jgi:hypothetical protein
MNTLQNKLYKVGDNVEIGGQAKQITAINTIDGLKVYLYAHICTHVQPAHVSLG